MKNVWLITFRSITFAQRAQLALRQAGIYTAMLRIPKSLATSGCGYCLRAAEKHVKYAMTLLHDYGIPVRKVYYVDENGRAGERMP